MKLSPVVKMTTIRSIIDVVVKKGWDMFQLDVNNVFLHGDLDEEVYIKIPQGMVVAGNSIVCKLKKSLYGLKLASRQWYCKLSDSLISLGYTVSKNYNSLLNKSDVGHLTIVAIHVDDILLIVNDDIEIAALKLFLDEQFKLKT